MWSMVAKGKMSISRPQPGWDLYFVMNVAMLPVQLHLCRGLRVARRLIPLGSYVATASMEGQSHDVQQLGALAKCFSSGEMMDF